MTELIGSRVLLRPLRSDDWDAWREVRLESKHWLEMWEPRAEYGAPDPVADREAETAIRALIAETIDVIAVLVEAGGEADAAEAPADAPVPEPESPATDPVSEPPDEVPQAADSSLPHEAL